MKNTANKLTVLRILMVLPATAVLLFDFFVWRWVISFLLFLSASYTDHLDGKLARKNNQITNFGKIMDPLADKMLVMSLFICFSGKGIISAFPVILMVCREFLITALRLLSIENGGNVISANVLGKLKTVIQMSTIGVIMISEAYIEITHCDLVFFSRIYEILIWLCALVTVVSGVEYVTENYKNINLNK